MAAHFTTVHNEAVAVRRSSSVEPSVWLDVRDDVTVLLRLETLREILAEAERLAGEGS